MMKTKPAILSGGETRIRRARGQLKSFVFQDARFIGCKVYEASDFEFHVKCFRVHTERALLRAEAAFIGRVYHVIM